MEYILSKWGVSFVRSNIMLNFSVIGRRKQLRMHKHVVYTDEHDICTCTIFVCIWPMYEHLYAGRPYLKLVI